MVLQVHDELVFEVPKTELETVKEIAKRCMELDQPLKVPLIVDINHGPSWKEGKSIFSCRSLKLHIVYENGESIPLFNYQKGNL